MEKLRIFVVSPSDMTAERAKVETAASSLEPLAEYLGIVLRVDDWSEVVPNMGRPEQVILDQIEPDSWDILIGILWHRFGTPPKARDPQTQKAYQSGTEEEFKTAYRLWQQYGRPRIVMYRCTRNVPLDALDPDQFKRVKDFFAQFEASKGEHPGIYQSFETVEAFEKLLYDNLQKLLIDYGEKLKGEPVEPEVIQSFAPKIPDNLPRRAPFFGRDKEMDVVMRALSPDDRTWGVLVDGIGGIGKSALAVEAAYRCKEKVLFDAFIFVSAKENILDPKGIRDLKPAARTLDEFLNETARVLGEAGITKLAGDAKRRALLDALRGIRSLLIYDNLETLAKEEQEALADFLRELPSECKAITTSRRRGGEGAVWLRLEKLEWEAARSIIESEMGRDPQLAKKLQRAGEVRWQQLYDETKGSPLALVHTLGLMRVRASLTFDGALDLLRGNRNPDLQRFIFQEARRELTVNDDSALRALSFFAPSATFEACMNVSELSRNALETTIDRLSALSLVDISAGEERYALHPLTRNFVREELLSDVQIARDTGMSFANYWLAYAQQYGGDSQESYKTYDRLEAEWSNLEEAAEWLWQTTAIQGEEIGDEVAAQMSNDLAGALSQFLSFSTRWDERIKLSTQAYETMRKLNLSNAGWRAYDVAWIYYYRGDDKESTHWADRSAEAWAMGGSKLEQSVGKQMHGLLATEREDYDAAEKLYQDALAICRELKMEKDIGSVLNSLGELELKRRCDDKAESYFREALDIHQRRNDTDMIPTVLSSLGLLELQRERWMKAREWYEQALPLSRELGRQEVVAFDLYGLALVYEQEGQTGLSLSMAREALAIYERLQHANLAAAQNLVERLIKKAGSEK